MIEHISIIHHQSPTLLLELEAVRPLSTPPLINVNRISSRFSRRNVAPLNHLYDTPICVNSPSRHVASQVTTNQSEEHKIYDEIKEPDELTQIPECECDHNKATYENIPGLLLDTTV